MLTGALQFPTLRRDLYGEIADDVGIYCRCFLSGRVLRDRWPVAFQIACSCVQRAACRRRSGAGETNSTIVLGRSCGLHGGSRHGSGREADHGAQSPAGNPPRRSAARRGPPHFHRPARPQGAARVENGVRRQSRPPLEKTYPRPLTAGLSTVLHRVIARPLCSASDDSRIGAVSARSYPKRGLKCLPTRRARP